MNEIREIENSNVNVEIIPIRPEYLCNDFNIWFCKAHSFYCYYLALKTIITKPIKTIVAINNLLLNTKTVKKKLKNIYIIPKALAICDHLTYKECQFIHAHWLATVSSVAYLVSEITGIPWGVTTHRFDLYEKNAIEIKMKSASFIRCIDENGYKFLSTISDSFKDKIYKIYMGVDIPEYNMIKSNQKKKCFNIAIPANLVKVKGHSYAFKALKILNKEFPGIFKCNVYGIGPLKEQLITLVHDLNLENTITFEGNIKNEDLLAKYKKKEIDLVLLPSVDLGNNEHEGIPVCLIEAMAYCVPVISTKTGGIPELVIEGSGILVPDKSSKAIAHAIEDLYSCDNMETILFTGYERVRKDFNNITQTMKVLELIEKADKV
ncbi:MAG: glycosyltransferase [Bacilli bacterium]